MLRRTLATILAARIPGQISEVVVVGSGNIRAALARLGLPVSVHAWVGVAVAQKWNWLDSNMEKKKLPSRRATMSLKDKGELELVQQVERLKGMRQQSMKAELMMWVEERISLLEQLVLSRDAEGNAGVANDKQTDDL